MLAVASSVAATTESNSPLTILIRVPLSSSGAVYRAAISFLVSWMEFANARISVFSKRSSARASSSSSSSGCAVSFFCSSIMMRMSDSSSSLRSSIAVWTADRSGPPTPAWCGSVGISVGKATMSLMFSSLLSNRNSAVKSFLLPWRAINEPLNLTIGISQETLASLPWRAAAFIL